MSTLMEIARGVMARLSEAGEKGEKGGKGSGAMTFSPLSPFSPDGRANTSPPLTGRESWNVRSAIKLMVEADVLVERLGVDGRHPEVAAAATMVVSAVATLDMETVRFAVSEFVAVVRRLASVKNRESACPKLSGPCRNVRPAEATGTASSQTC